ncbi:MAG: homoserine kinase [Verrucomicrobiae bacterium]|nr:homoserine kinase [Verrucomicrobiae bacterium]
MSGLIGQSVRVRVPATTSNLGPGFDTLGIALKLYNEIDVCLRPNTGVVMESAASGRGALRMAREAAGLFFKTSGLSPRGFTFGIRGNVPVARGLGSSVTLRLGIVGGLNELLNRPLDRQGLLDMLVELEHHPDNAAPAIHGGFVVAGRGARGHVFFRRALSAGLKFVTVIPEFEVLTSKARQSLPAEIPFADAAANANRAAMLASAFLTGDFKKTGDFFEDRLHQPHRSKMAPQLYPALNAARNAGAIGGWLSGSGPAIMALALEREDEVSAAMKAVFQRDGIGCVVRVLGADNRGFVCRVRR